MSYRALAIAVFTGVLFAHGATVTDEFKIKREAVYEFASKPSVTRQGDKVTISFATKGRCDVTVAIEDQQGKVVRHLACGVLGDNAPEPFKRGSLQQTLVWDGKNDQDEYVQDKDSCTVRVSLGLRAAFEKNLLWDPRRRHGLHAPIFQATPEGVYIYDGGNGIDFVRLFDHSGKYLKTVYPFPADKVDKVLGIQRKTWLQDGENLSLKPTYLQQTLLTCGNLYGYNYPEKYAIKAREAEANTHYGMYGNAATIMAVSGNRLVLGKTYLFRMATDGSSGGVQAEGPAVALVTEGERAAKGQMIGVAPYSAALSPDGKTLYLTRYMFCHYGKATADIVTSGNWQHFHCVLKMDVTGDKPPELFAGSLELNKWGSDDKSFKVPTSVATDKAGRVYVADYLNDRVQIFAPDGKLLQSLKSVNPAIVSINAKTQEIYVFSTLVHNIFFSREQKYIKTPYSPKLTVYGNFDDLKEKLSVPLPKEYGGNVNGTYYSGYGSIASAAVDGYTEPPTIWLTKEWDRANVMNRARLKRENVRLYRIADGGVELVEDFETGAKENLKITNPPPYGRMRLYANPKTGKVYATQGQAFDDKSFKTVLELDPTTGKSKLVELPFDAEDMCFDHEGYAYLRSIGVVMRFNPNGWREIPWDYGEEKAKVFTSSSSDRREAAANAGLILPADGGWHHGGMFVSLRGNILVACGINIEKPTEGYTTGEVVAPGRKYLPVMYPGRSVQGRGGAPLLHIWNKHGEAIFEDALPGIGGNTYGLGLDRDNGIYMMHSATQLIDGKKELDHLTGTIIKTMPGKGKFLCEAAPVPLTAADLPKRPADLSGNGLPRAWVEGVEWMYGGVGLDGKNAGTGCACWNSRMAFDYFNRTFAPEVNRYKIAVLDGNGNLIMRIGRYGNPDSAGAGSAAQLGGDEVGMVHGAYLATQTDQRLYVADPANDRVFSVALDYNKTEKVALKDVKDQL